MGSDYIDVDELVCRGIDSEKEGFPERAMDHYKEAVSRFPDHAYAHFFLGVAYQEKGAFAEAIVQYRKVLEMDPEKAQNHYNLGSAYFEKGMRREAKQEFEERMAATNKSG